MQVAALLGAVLISASSAAHIDVVRISLAQLYLGAEVAGIVRIDSVEDHDFSHGGPPALREVLSATMLHQYKGEPRQHVHFFLDAHGPADYRAGDLAALFLEATDPADPLHQLSPEGPEVFVSRQVRNTEHRLTVDEVEDYRRVLGTYATPRWGGKQTKPAVSETLLYMLASGSISLAQSALIDWQNLGAAVDFSETQIDALTGLTRSAECPIHLRLSILKTLTAQKLVAQTAWDPLFESEDGDNLLALVRATRGREHKHFQPYLVRALGSDSLVLSGAAARALAHPTYAGVEPLLETLLRDDDLRLNYAAISGLLGIGSPAADAMLRQAAESHASKRVRRMVTARLRASLDRG
ncbi:HEAT repeat domain-containing protein [Chromatocurvus halotolerans]|uniref:HEAT repeat protein n=1 Tax=Chromatocurvus halotolerans TaxID=1132028 RepID=A0A4R2KQL1_9GAMM|nr:HEAT repeat domain-containing protein [Chromatocurvus halotolerans]TCO76561.1 hypothetical protein EV688_10415 [Chromatocurvus halotolerans]